MRQIIDKVNFFCFSLVGVIGVAMSTEIIREDDVPDKIDDALMLLLAIVAACLYKKYNGEFRDLKAGYLILFAAVAIKAFAIAIEFADAEAVGDDIGVMTILVASLVFVTWMILKNKTA